MSMQSETREFVGCGASAFVPEQDRRAILCWFNLTLCAAAAPFVVVMPLRRKWSTSCGLERLDRRVLADIGLMEADVVAAVNA